MSLRRLFDVFKMFYVPILIFILSGKAENASQEWSDIARCNRKRIKLSGASVFILYEIAR